MRHAKYGKILHRKTVCHVHDEENESHLGDTVEIVESRPRSKTKRCELVRVVTKSRLVDLAAMRAAAKHTDNGTDVDARVASYGASELPLARFER